MPEHVDSNVHFSHSTTRKLPRTNKLIKLNATLPFRALSSLGAPLVHIPSIMIKSLWKNETRPTCWTAPKERILAHNVVIVNVVCVAKYSVVKKTSREIHLHYITLSFSLV